LHLLYKYKIIKSGGWIKVKSLKNEKEDVTERLKNLVKKKNTQIVVIKAGSIKTTSNNSNSSFNDDYYPS